MKQTVLYKLHLLLPLLAAVLLMPQSLAAQTCIAVVSDPHVMTSSLLESGAETQSAWTTYYAGQRKMLLESEGLFTQFVNAIKSSSVDIVLVTGDLTKDGEEVSHTFVRTKLSELTGKKVYVIPGNHDFGEEGNNTLFKADGTTDNATKLSRSGFATFYDGYGYGTGSTIDPNGSLSYVAEPVTGLVLLAIDSSVGASIPSATLNWICEQATAARAAGKQVIAMMHHPLIEHIKGAAMFIDTYTVASNTDVRDKLIAAGVKVILTGHFHTSDIAYDWNSDPANGIYDINTGSLISYPCDYRMLTLSSDMQTLDVATASLTPSGMTTEECKTWLENRVKTIASNTLNSSPYNMMGLTAEEISFLVNSAASGFILHAEGDEHSKSASMALLTSFTSYTGTSSYYSIAKGLITSILSSMLTDKSDQGGTHENQTNDRELAISLPSLDEDVTLTTVGADGWASYCTGHDLDITQTSGVKAYVVTAQDASKATLTEVTQIPGGEGFLLKGSPGTYMLKATSGVGAITNLLVGTLEDTAAPSGSYVLANKSEGFGFYLTGTVTIPARKAYLPSTSSARMLAIDGEGGTTGISTIDTENENRQPIYTLQGTKAGNLHRGLYIQNGKKIIIK